MTRDAFMCLSGKRPAQCGFRCDFCYRAGTVCVDYCDACGREIDWEEKPEDYHNPETGKDICCKCRNKIESEEILCQMKL